MDYENLNGLTQVKTTQLVTSNYKLLLKAEMYFVYFLYFELLLK